MTGMLLSGRFDLQIQHNMVDASTEGGPEPDPAWRFTDAHGHEHHPAARPDLYPTLCWVVDEEDYTVDEGDGHIEEYPGESHWECAVCGEHITPGMTGPSPFRTHEVGQVSATLTGARSDGARVAVMLTGDDYEALRDADDKDAEALRLLDGASPTHTLSIWRDL